MAERRARGLFRGLKTGTLKRAQIRAALKEEHTDVSFQRKGDAIRGFVRARDRR
jgi:hypothetical protein